jgi:PAS domain-containing protein
MTDESTVTAPQSRRAEAWFIADADGRCLATSPLWATLAGIAAGEPLTGGPWHRVLAPAERERVSTQVSLLCNFSAGYSGECHLARPGGRLVRVLLSVVPVTVPGRPEAAFAGVIAELPPGVVATPRPGEVEPWAVAAYSAARERLFALPKSA